MYKKNTAPNKDAVNISLNLDEISRNFYYNSSKVIDFKNIFEKDENVRKIYDIGGIRKEWNSECNQTSYEYNDQNSLYLPYTYNVSYIFKICRVKF